MCNRQDCACHVPKRKTVVQYLLVDIGQSSEMQALPRNAKERVDDDANSYNKEVEVVTYGDGD